MSFQIRLIQPEDNQAAAKIIRGVLAEFGCSGPGYACNDPEMDDLYSAYQCDRRKYWVIYNQVTGDLVGCGGFSQLKGTSKEEKICELQKLYILPTHRGLGLGKELLILCIQEAKLAGYKYMYLESLPQLKQAVNLYKKFRFEFIDKPMGNTGHNEKCSIFMLCKLDT